jgi:hypothetical protein
MNTKTKRTKMNCATDIGQVGRIAKRVSIAAALVALSVAGSGCYQAATANQGELPKESYERPAEQPFSSSDYVFKPDQMVSFYDVPGEFGHAMEGAQYGFESLSFIITETQPGVGRPCMSTTPKKHMCYWKGRPPMCSVIKSSQSKVLTSSRSGPVFRIPSLILAPSRFG